MRTPNLGLKTAQLARRAPTGAPPPALPPAAETVAEEVAPAPRRRARKTAAKKATAKATTRTAAKKTTAKRAAENTGTRAYRRMPEPEEVMDVYRQTGSITAVAEHFGVPRHTVAGGPAGCVHRDTPSAGNS